MAFIVSQTRVLVCLVGLLTTFSSTTSAETNEYIERNGTRFEGLMEADTASLDMLLTSFVAYRERRPLTSDDQLKLDFYVPVDETFHITAREFVPIHHYFMRPTRTDWPIGWQQFSDWPAATVLNELPLGIDDIAVIARIGNDEDGSGLIAPVLLYITTRPDRVVRYEMIVVSIETFRELEFVVTPYQGSDAIVSRIFEEEFVQNEPIPLIIDLSDQAAGWYTVEIFARIVNETSGPERKYHFYHQPHLGNAGRLQLRQFRKSNE